MCPINVWQSASRRLCPARPQSHKWIENCSIPSIMGIAQLSPKRRRCHDCHPRRGGLWEGSHGTEPSRESPRDSLGDLIGNLLRAFPHLSSSLRPARRYSDAEIQVPELCQQLAAFSLRNLQRSRTLSGSIRSGTPGLQQLTDRHKGIKLVHRRFSLSRLCRQTFAYKGGIFVEERRGWCGKAAPSNGKESQSSASQYHIEQVYRVKLPPITMLSE